MRVEVDGSIHFPDILSCLPALSAPVVQDSVDSLLQHRSAIVSIGPSTFMSTFSVVGHHM